jgi:hypothetical protein
MKYVWKVLPTFEGAEPRSSIHRLAGHRQFQGAGSSGLRGAQRLHDLATRRIIQQGCPGCEIGHAGHLHYGHQRCALPQAGVQI